MENKVSVFNTALRYGLIGGLIFVIWTLITVVIFDRTNFFITALGSLISLGVTIGISIMVIAFHRDKELGGFISFSQAFVVSLLALVIAGAISSAFTVVDMTIISSDYYQGLKDDMVFQYEERGMDDDTIDMVIKFMDFFQSPIIWFFGGILGSAFFGAIVSLITALIMKREEPMFTN